MPKLRYARTKGIVKKGEWFAYSKFNDLVGRIIESGPYKADWVTPYNKKGNPRFVYYTNQLGWYCHVPYECTFSVGIIKKS